MRVWLIHQALACAVIAAFACRDAAATEVRVGVILEQLQLREDLVRPFRWSGPAAGPSLSWSRSHERAEHDAHLDLAFAYVTNRFDQESFAFRLRGHYGYLRTMGPTFALGGALRANLLPTYHANWDDAHLHWFTSYDLGPFARFRCDRLGPGSLSLSVSVPLVALVSRPPRYRTNKQDELKSVGYWISRPHEDLRAVAVPAYFAAAVDASYMVSAPARWSWGVAYRFDLRGYDAPQPVATLSHGLRVEARRAW